MPIAQVIILAVVQGFTEFLPISSTAHLYLSSWLLGWKPETLDFDIALHMGTLLAMLLYFFPDWIQIVAQAFRVAIGHDQQLKGNQGLLWLLERVSQGTRELGSLRGPDAILIGLSQAVAIIPGTSRSGITISSGLLRDFSRESAARFSFLLATPAIAAAAAKALYDMHKQSGLGAILNPTFLVGVAVSAATGCAVIAWFLQYLRRGSLRPFVYYRIIFGIIVLALALV